MIVPRHRRKNAAKLSVSILRKKKNSEWREQGTPRAGLRRGGADGHKFVLFDFGGNSRFAVFVGFDAHHPPVASYVDVARGDHLLRQRQDEIDLAAILESRFGEEIQAAIAYVSRM